MRRLPLGLLIVAAGMSIASGAVADPHPAHPVAAAPPPGRVGRLAAVSGGVAIQTAGAAGSFPAERNDPVAAGSALATEPQSRAAIEIGADAIDLAAASKIVIAALDARGMMIRLVRGRLGLTLRRGAGAFGIDLPQGEVWLDEKGAYGIASGSAKAAESLTVFAGSARLFAAGAEIEVGPGERVDVAAAAPLSLTVAPAAADAFAASWRSRTVAVTGLAAPAFVSPDLTGFAALAGAGHWRRTGAYGEVWLPDAPPADWAPYRDGHWARFAPWGWTWIDAEPWGFAPSHYGRWARIGQHWAWVPGDLATNPIYLPAVVAFIGTPGIGVSYAGGTAPAIGWFPLAPGETYWPSYTGDLDYIRAANRGDIPDPAAVRPLPDGRLPVEVVDRRFANRLDASVVPRAVFAAGQPVMPALIELPRERLQNVPVLMGSPRIGPPAPPPPVVAVLARPAPAVRLAEPSGTAAKRARWIATVHLAATRSRHFQQAARLRHFAVLHLREPAPSPRSSAEPLRWRRLVALRRPSRLPEHKKKILR